jgi:hypothetical protein
MMRVVQANGVDLWAETFGAQTDPAILLVGGRQLVREQILGGAREVGRLRTGPTVPRRSTIWSWHGSSVDPG